MAHGYASTSGGPLEKFQKLIAMTCGVATIRQLTPTLIFQELT